MSKRNKRLGFSNICFFCLSKRILSEPRSRNNQFIRVYTPPTIIYFARVYISYSFKGALKNMVANVTNAILLKHTISSVWVIAACCRQCGSVALLDDNWRQIVLNCSESNNLGTTYFSVCTCRNLCFGLFIFVFSVIDFSALLLPFIVSPVSIGCIV